MTTGPWHAFLSPRFNISFHWLRPMDRQVTRSWLKDRRLVRCALTMGPATGLFNPANGEYTNWIALSWRLNKPFHAWISERFCVVCQNYPNGTWILFQPPIIKHSFLNGADVSFRESLLDFLDIGNHQSSTGPTSIFLLSSCMIPRILLLSLAGSCSFNTFWTDSRSSIRTQHVLRDGWRYCWFLLLIMTTIMMTIMITTTMTINIHITINIPIMWMLFFGDIFIVWSLLSSLQFSLITCIWRLHPYNPTVEGRNLWLTTVWMYKTRCLNPG